MQKHSVKLLLKENKKNKLHQYPIYIRITIDRRTTFISTGHYILKAHWDEKNESVKDTHPTYREINTDILARKKEVLGKILDAGYRQETTSAQTVKEQAAQKGDLTNLFEFADRFSEEMKHKRSKGLRDNWRKHLAKLEEFRGSRYLTFEEVTVPYLNAFENWLRDGGIKARKEDSSSYIYAIMKTIRTMFNAASGKYTDWYPFGKGGYELPEPNYEEKEKLTLEELDALAKFADTTPNQRLREVAAWFLFGCYTGLRISDWFQFDFSRHVHKGYISLKATKNDGMSNIPIHSRLRDALDRCRRVPLTLVEQYINDDIKAVAKELKIKKKLSTHCARKTFAVTMCAERGVSLETCANLMAITVEICAKNYYRVTPAKVKAETERAWQGL